MKIERCPGVYEPEDDSFLLTGIPEIKGSILEIGCGTGFVGLSYALSGEKVVMTDLSPAAALCARNNALRNGIESAVIITDLFSGIKGKFDCCIFNPPYLPSGPGDDGAWSGGNTGREVTYRFLREFKKYCEVAFIIESTLSRIKREDFPSLKFSVVRSMDYEFEALNVLRVE